MKLNPKAAALIDGKNFGNLAFVTSKGEPHVSPVWIDRNDDLILINAAEFRTKIKQLKIGQKVMLSVMDQQNPYSKVLVRGHVVKMTKDGALEQNSSLCMKYLGMPDDPDRPPGDRVLIMIQPDKITD